MMEKARSPELNYKIETSLTSIEQNLKKIQNSIEQSKTLKQELQELFEKTEKLEQLVENHPDAKARLAKQFSTNKKLIPLFEEMKGDLSELMSSMHVLEQKEQKANQFLEDFQSCKVYQLKSVQNLGQFILDLSTQAGISDFIAKPKILGILDIGKIANQLSFKLYDLNSIHVPIQQLQKFLNYIYSHRPFTPILLSNSNISILLQTKFTIDVRSKPEFLKEI